jgi:hypothetical protein
VGTTSHPRQFSRRLHPTSVVANISVQCSRYPLSNKRQPPCSRT